MYAENGRTEGICRGWGGCLARNGLEEKGAYEVWFKCVRRNKYAMFDEVARERGAWDGLCVEPQVRALAGRGFCKPCSKFYYDNKGLEAHQKRRHPRPPVSSDERDADGKREA